jgi:hypothetical protein
VVCPKSGYKAITGIELLNAISLLRCGEISFRAFRAYLASFSLLAIREAASRVRLKNREKRGLVPRYRISELSRATGASKSETRRDLELLKGKNLLLFSEGEIRIQKKQLTGTEELTGLVRSPSRPVPVPRNIIRFLARSKKRSVALVSIAYMLRGLSIDRNSGEVRGKGTAKALWIADLTGLSLRSVRSARAELIALGWITDDEGSTQWKLNRDGAYFVINLDWEKPEQAARANGRGENGRPTQKTDEPMEVDFAPPAVKNCGNFAPPYKDRKTSSNEEIKNQKALTDQKPTGVFSKTGKERGKPSFRDVQTQDLWNFSRVEELYFQACALGILEDCEASALNFLAAAVRARNVTDGDPVRVFLGIVRRGLWHHITQAEEEQARRALLHYRDKYQDRFKYRKIRKAA